MTTSYVAAESSAGNPVLNIVVFVAFIVITMAVVLRAGKPQKKPPISTPVAEHFPENRTAWLSRATIFRLPPS